MKKLENMPVLDLFKIERSTFQRLDIQLLIDGSIVPVAIINKETHIAFVHAAHMKIKLELFGDPED